MAGAVTLRQPVPCRLFDSGLLTGEQNTALDRVLWQVAGEQRPALRFYRFQPTVSVGAFERATTAVRRDYCVQRGIAIVRRLTGGGALYHDAGQLCWTLALPAGLVEPSLRQINQRHAEAVVAALDTLGVEARFTFPNDLETPDGRKLGACFAIYDEEVALLQGTLLETLDLETLLAALRFPTEKLSAEGVRSARQRFAGLRELTGRYAPPICQAAVQEALARTFVLEPAGVEPLTPTGVGGTPCDDDAPALPLKAFRRTAGGVLHAALDIEDERLVAVELTGTVQAAPPRLLGDLSRSLSGSPLGDWERRCEAHLAAADTLGFASDDVRQLLRAALARITQAQLTGLTIEQANGLMVHDAAQRPAEEILREATVMLTPYCAKPPDCPWRYRDGCPECGKCEVGDAYRLARERGLRVVSITNFEHLERTLGEMKADGVAAYVGMCCSNFYLKRHRAFEQAGMAAVLLDISGANCYELHQEDAAYAGRFEAQARLNGDVVEKVLRFVPPVRAED